MKNNFLLSIIIPTKDRQYYAAQTSKLMLDSIHDSRIEIIVQDNSILHQDNKYFNFTDPRFKYFYVEDKMTVVDNFNLALNNSTGDYVCFIGDDDWVLPNIVELAEFMLRNSIDSIKPLVKVGYNWSNTSNVKTKLVPNLLTIENFNYKIRKINHSKGLKSLLFNGGQNYQKFDLAKVYHGITSRKIVDQIKIKYNTVFGGISPDIYSSTIVSLENQSNSYEIDFPFIISGVCSKSTSSDSTSGKHVGKIQNIPHFNGINGYEIDYRLPKIYSVETVWVDSLFKALIKTKNEYLIQTLFNFKIFNYYLIKNNKKFIIKNFSDNKRYIKLSKNFTFFIYSLRVCFSKFISKLIKILNRILNYTIVKRDVLSIEIANNLILLNIDPNKLRKSMLKFKK